MFEFNILSNDADEKLKFIREENGIYEYKFSCKSNGQRITLVTRIKCINCFTVWNHTVNFDRQLRAEWSSSKCISNVLSGLPYHALIGQNGNNVLAIAVSDVKNQVEIKSGIREENAAVTCKIVFNTPVKENENYETIIRLDTRCIPYYECIYSASEWWSTLGYSCAHVPESAKRPMYSSWYSFHQLLSHDEIIKECELAKKLGMDTIILDDGWQTEDTQRGYAYCGDWKSAYSKVGDMNKLVNSVHGMGMKIMLWYNIAFMGEYAKNSAEFKGMYMGDKLNGRYTLDPRYYKVRKYLTDLFSNAVMNWKLDGLKIDFVDSFVRSEDDVVTDKMDFPILEDAVEELIKSISDSLYKLNPEIMIEFRQNYIGPLMRKYANIFRVADCPDDSLRNRLGVVNLRLTSGECAVHSDMLMWNYDEPVEIAAKQIINVLFSVPQISVRIEKLSNEHYKMLEFYLSLWIKYKELFADTKISAECPEANYSKLCAQSDKKQAVVCYCDNTVNLDENKEKVIIVNGTAKDEFFIYTKRPVKYNVYNCMGENVLSGKFNEGVLLLSIPVSGIAEFY